MEEKEVKIKEIKWEEYSCWGSDIEDLWDTAELNAMDIARDAKGEIEPYLLVMNIGPGKISDKCMFIVEKESTYKITILIFKSESDKAEYQKIHNL